MLDLSEFASPLFSEAYRRILAEAGGISEPRSRYAAAAPPSVRERILRCIWFDQSLATDRLRTDDAQKLRVLSPGWWNLEAGPDFRNAALRLGAGPVAKGDIEVHLHAGLWHTHGHHTDPNYNGVILHVVLWNDTGSTSVATAAGATVPQLTLEPYLQTPLAELAETVDPAEYPEASAAISGRCHALLEQGKVTLDWLARFLDHAGDQRIADKARRLAARASGDDDQLLYEAVAEGLGYKRNKAPAAELARRLPLALIRERVARRDKLAGAEGSPSAPGGPKPPLAQPIEPGAERRVQAGACEGGVPKGEGVLLESETSRDAGQWGRHLACLAGGTPAPPPVPEPALALGEHARDLRDERPVAIEALLFGAAGLLPDRGGDPRYDAAAREHIEQLRALWSRLGADLAESALDPAQWSFDGTRPANFPTRRIAALARFIARHLDEGISAAVRHALGPPGTPRLSPRELTGRRARLLDLFLSLGDPFWDTRSHFAGKPMPRPLHLVGADRAHTLAIDCLLPALLYQARRDGDRPFEELLHQLYAAYPKLPSTSITRFMALRLFGKPDTDLKLLRSARRQQGLYQVYTDFCDSEQATCARCPLVRVLES